MSRARPADAFVVLALSVILAGVFLLAGIPKLIGIEPVGLQAAAMRGFPAWTRVLVGLVEIAGAIALLIPALTGFAAIALAFLMIPAALTQYASHQGGLWVPVVVFVLLAYVAWRRNATYVETSYRDFAGRPHPLLYEGIVAGLIGAASIALWFFVVDMVAGRPFFTPSTLGHGLLAVLGPSANTDTVATRVLVYTVFHIAAFMLVGLVAALIVDLAKREPSILFGFLVLFVAIEVGFYGLVGLLGSATPLGALAWYQVMIGNLIAAAAMGTYFWRTHRELGGEFRRSLDWDGPPVPAHRDDRELVLR